MSNTTQGELPAGKWKPMRHEPVREKHKNFAYTVSLVVIFALLLFGFYLYSNTFERHLESSSQATFHEIVLQQKFNVDSAVSSKITALENLACSFSHISDDRAIVLSLLTDIEQNSEFDFIAITNLDGKGLLSDGAPIDLSRYDQFAQVKSGETILIDPVPSIRGQADIIPIATPVRRDGEIVGVLVGALSLHSLEQLMLPAYDEQAYGFVVNKQGEIMFNTHSPYMLSDKKNILDIWEGMRFENGYSYEQLAENIAADKPGTVSYGIGQQRRFAEYMPLDINNWSIVVAVPLDVISPDMVSITKSTSWLIVLVILCFGLLVFYIMWQQHQNTKALESIAYYDEFSGAPTLAKFKQEAAKFIADTPDKHLLMVKFDVAQFKLINQILGDHTGDNVIKNLAKSLEANTPGKYKRYARLHDDEFLVLHVYDEIGEILETRDHFKEMFYQRMGAEFQYNIKLVSGHYYMSSENCTDVTEAIEKANVAHRRAKHTGREICIYDQSFIEQSLKQRSIEIMMHPALANGEFKVYLQPKYELTNETVVGAEALVRWVTPQGEMILPNDFIPIFEENGFVVELDFYMFEQSCKIIEDWVKQGYSPVPISVNFSRLHLFNTDFVRALCRFADQYHIPHHLLEIELTESIMFDKGNSIQSVLDELHGCGFMLSMDDFGSGYSSLGLLKNLPVDVLKIDRSFFSYDNEARRGRLIIEGIMQLAKKLGIQTVAEGVEIKEHIDLLREVGCDMVQGYYYAKPLPADQFVEWTESEHI